MDRSRSDPPGANRTERPAWLKARAGKVAITIGLLMCVPGVAGVAWASSSGSTR